MFRKKRIIFLLFLIISLFCYGQGLQFAGNEHSIEKRTSYAVFDKKHPTFQDHFQLQFDILFRHSNSFGYIFRMKDEASNQIYNLTFTYERDKKSLLKFNLEGKSNLLSVEIDNDLLKQQKWMNLAFDFDLKNDKLVIAVDDQKYNIESANLPKRLSPEIVFGKGDHVVDVPEFTLKELTVDKYKFLFRESSLSLVHDSGGSVVGSVQNPIWLINDTYHWREVYRYESKLQSGVTFNPQKQDILFFNRDSLVFFNVQSNTDRVVGYANPCPLDIRLGTNFIDTLHQLLYVYEVNNLPIDDVTVAQLNLDSYTWTATSRSSLPMQLHHHAGYFDEQNQKYVLFGGFGNTRYNKEFLSFDTQSGRWDTIPFAGDKVSPRYFTSLMKDPNSEGLYLFGGMGNDAGDQALGYTYHYDLYYADLKAKNIRQLWSIPWNNENIVPVRSMLMLDNESVYALCYPEHRPQSHLQLYRFSLQDGAFEMLGDSIPIHSEKIHTNANLFYNAELNQLYCIVQEFDNDISSQTTLYSLSAPPAHIRDLSLYATGEQQSAIPWWVYVLGVLGIAFVGYLLYRNMKKASKSSPLPQKPDLAPSIAQSEPLKDKANAIYLFGDFTVYDKSGKDITYMFSTRLKLAFFLLIGGGYDGGITSQEFSKALWPDRMDYNVKNLRGVTINQLRKILAELNGVELVFNSEKAVFRLDFSDNCYCDCNQFVEHLRHFDKISGDAGLIHILQRGEFLKGIDDVAIIAFKEKVLGRLKSLLPIDIENAYEQQKYEEAIQLAALLDISDNLSLIALYYKIHSLIQLQSEGAAKRVFALFQAAYLNRNADNFPFSYASFVEKPIDEIMLK